MPSESAASIAPLASTIPQLDQMLLSLVAILALLFVTVWAMKRFQLGSRLAGRGTVRIEEGLSLGGRERLVVVNVDGRRLLLGVTASSIRALCEIDSACEVRSASRDDRGRGEFERRLERERMDAR